MSIQHHIAVSAQQITTAQPAEHNAIRMLYETYECAQSLSRSLSASADALKSCEEAVVAEIQEQFETMLSALAQRRQALLLNLSAQHQTKQRVLRAQQQATAQHLEAVAAGKQMYERTVSSQHLSIAQRKESILGMVRQLLNTKGVARLIMAPKLCFDAEAHVASLEAMCGDALQIKDCDEPKAMTLKLRKATSTTISVEYALHEHVEAAPLKVTEVALEYALLPKRFVAKTKAKSKTKSKRKQKRKRRSRRDANDPDDSSNSGTGSDSGDPSCLWGELPFAEATD